ncbi:uncharacterized protein LOC116342280 [Contarinia nasturtii]|uniref:uncharacterized protein LOC116342280 n=1 Tax=Contarinia nasturtii TaxID=265458 RepID=UPI0012D4AF76|nr:uncharacterized protein LOC116342280 [Contarinia nasturtii]
MNSGTITIFLVMLAVASIEAGLCESSARGTESSKQHEFSLNLKVEGRSTFVTLSSNITTRPLKLLIDCGATLSLVASDVIKPGAVDESHREIVYGCENRDIETLGLAHVMISLKGNRNIDIQMHVMNRTNIRPNCDGYLGFDVMVKYNMTVDLDKHKLIFRFSREE